MRSWPFPRGTRGLRAWVALLVLGAVAASLRRPSLSLSDAEVLAVLPLLSMLEVEAGRQAEGGRVEFQRAHKGLSAWPFAAVLLCGSTLAILVTVPTYAYARWRGMKVPLLKWVGSGALLSLSAAAAQPLVPSLRSALLVPGIVAAGAVFLAVEALCFTGCALSGEVQDEAWLKAQLRSRAFYGNEVFVLCQAAVIAVLWTVTPPLVVIVLPSYVVLQRALLHAPLRRAAETDAKTGLLLLHAWERRAAAMLDRRFSVVLIDLDHFKLVNDDHGHLVGDDVLAACAAILRHGVRPSDLVGRFGGEEFCLLLPGSDVREAVAVAERLRLALAAAPVEGLAVTASFGVYASEPVPASRLREALACADLALYAAKSSGRNVVRSHRPATPVSVPHQRDQVQPART